MVTRSRLLKKNANQKAMQRYACEVCGVLIAAVAIFICISLISYKATDESICFFSTEASEIKNWGGAFGAWCSALLIYLFGSASFFIWLIFVLGAFFIFIGKPWLMVVGRLAGLGLSSAGCSGLLSLLHFDLRSATPGGLLGYVITKYLQPLFGFYGLAIILFATVWTGLLYAIRISIFDIIILVFKNIFLSMFSVFSKISRLVSGGFYFLKSLFGQSPKNIVLQVFSPAHTSDSLPDDENIISSDGFALHENSVDFGSKDQKNLRASKMSLITVRKSVSKIIFGKYNLIRLPNAVIDVNIFTHQMKLGQSWYDLLCESLNSYKEGSFALPNAIQFARKPVMRDLGLENEVFVMRGKMLEEKLARFGLNGKVTAIHPGPVITLFEYKPDIDSKISKIMSLEDDLAMVLTAHSIRIIAPIPGKNVIGFEIANQTRHEILISQVLCTPAFDECESELPLVLGVDVIGKPIICDLVGMPHLLVAGATGSGKSVGMNAMLTSLLCKKSPEEMKLILIDPKRLEFTPYTDIPHLLFPIVTQPHKAAGVLKWLVQEMEERYEMMARCGVRNIIEYKKFAKEKSFEQIPFIVVMIDELADLMMVAARDVETQLIRLAQMARAAGIHLIVATQRPSVDVVTGLIKVNFPSRVSFRVSSKVDSRTILDGVGAEKLLGKGDLLFMHASSPNLKRVHGAYISDEEIESLTDFLRKQASPEYLDLNDELRRCTTTQISDQEDELYESVVSYIKTIDEISISLLQRQYRIGFNRSARIIEKLELDGFVAPAQGSKPRKVLH